MLVRSMTPEVIFADEIGNSEDISAINYATTCGVKGIFTVHGGGIDDLYSRQYLNELLDLNIFEIIIFLDKYKKGEIKSIYYLDKNGSKKYKQWILFIRGENICGL